VKQASAEPGSPPWHGGVQQPRRFPAAGPGGPL